TRLPAPRARRGERSSRGRVYDESRRVQTLLGEPLLCLGDRRAPQRLDQLGSFEQARELVLGRPVADVRVFDDLAQAAASIVFPNEVGDDSLLLRRAGEEERERIPEEAGE